MTDMETAREIADGMKAAISSEDARELLKTRIAAALAKVREECAVEDHMPEEQTMLQLLKHTLEHGYVYDLSHRVRPVLQEAAEKNFLQLCEGGRYYLTSRGVEYLREQGVKIPPLVSRAYIERGG